MLDSPFSYDGAPGAYRSGTSGLPTYGRPGTDFPDATAGMVLAAGTHSYLSYQLSPDTVYYLLPGVHIGTFQADQGDAFVGGRSGRTATVLSGNYSGDTEAIDSNFSDGNQPGVTIEYLTIEKYQPQGNGAAIDQNSNTGWTLRYDTLTLNAPGAGMIAGADSNARGQLHDAERPVRLPVLRRQLMGPRRADRRTLQRHHQRQRDQLQRHLRLRGQADQHGYRLVELQPGARPVPEPALRRRSRRTATRAASSSGRPTA